ncbi:unnamed protein product [Danaus chrysippus]|uniref:(African queen) hypothetical protein n=1 Tax=Danaus chrysippus TaxID=151541 RepID=A0A8J2R5X1_9NEOP|nr:unnamed protein product [Danaus chrysippus]
MYCLPTKSYDNTTELNWELTSIGHIAAPEEFCLQKNGLPVKRLCSGSYLLGSIWGGVEGTCNQNYKPSYTTTFLYNFVKDLVPENDTSRFLIDGLSFVLNDVNIIIPADIYYLSMSLKHILNKADENLTKIDMGNIGNIAWAIDRVMLLDTSYLRLSQTLNSTNVILDSVGGIINRLAVKEAKVGNTQRNFLSSYQLAVRPRFILQVSYPHINNVSGIAVTRTSSDDSFISMEIKPLFINTTLEDVLSIDNLEVATWVPMNVLQTLKKINYNGSKEDAEMNEDIYIIISVFYSDVMFQELNVTYNVNSRIVGVALPPGFISNLEEPIPLIYRDLVSAGPNKHCGYWDFQMNSMDSSPGHWSNKGCYLRKTNNTLTVCQCYHLTHFGQLIDFNRAKNNSDAHSRHSIPLNIISLIGSFLSLLGIMGMWVTACVFQTWRKKASTKVLLHLSSSIAMPLLIMIIFNLNDTIFVEDNGVCT